MKTTDSLDQQTMQDEIAVKLKEVLLGATWAQMGLLIICFILGLNILPVDALFITSNCLVFIGLLSRVLLGLYGKNLPSVKWRRIFTGLLTVTVFGWCLLLIDSFVENPLGLEGEFFYVIVLLGLLVGAVVNLSYSLRDFCIFTISIYVSSVTLFLGFHNTLLQGTGLLSTTIFFMFLFRQRNEAYSNWVRSVARNRELISIMDAFPGAISLLEGDRYIFANKTLSQIVQVEAQDFIGKKLGFSDSASGFYRAVHSFINGDSQRSAISLEIGTADNLRQNLVVMEKLAGFQQRCLIVSLDTHETFLTRKQLEEQKTHLSSSSKMAALGEMASGLAHEINNPLAILTAKTSMQISRIENEHEFNKEKILNTLYLIQKSGERINSIVRGLKFFARNSELDSPKVAKISQIIEDTLIFCEAKFANQEIKLEVGPVDDSIQIFCKDTKISQVLLNLLNNAFDAVATSSEKWVRLSVEVENNFIYLRVTDSGPGIPIEIRDKILQPFFTTKGVGVGTGLGLSISREIALEHNGHFGLVDKSKNTCFELKLPLFRSPQVVKGGM